MALAPIAEEAQLTQELAAQGKKAVRVTEIDGINYSSGKTMSLGLYRASGQ
jgi:hypothetical protein